MKRTWTKIQLDLLIKHYPMSEWVDLERMFPNHTHTAIKAKVYNLNLKRASDFVQNKSKFWTLKKETKLKVLYPNTENTKISKILGTTLAAVKNRAHKLGLKKEVNKGCFLKGNIPFNKGKKGICAAGSEKGWFKKGNIPEKYRKLGSIRITKDRYYEIKTADPKTWDFLHRVIWLENNKEEIKDDEIIIFIDSNRANIQYNNLKKITRVEHIANMKNTDTYIALTIDRDKEMIEELLKHPEIINLKRTILKLNKAIRDGEK